MSSESPAPAAGAARRLSRLRYAAAQGARVAWYTSHYALLRRMSGSPGAVAESNPPKNAAASRARLRAAFRALLHRGWSDGIRARHPAGPVYTFWDYFRRRWERNAGLRIDHILLSPSIAPRLQSAGVDLWARGEPKPSDHAPVWVKLAPESKAAPRKAVAKAKPRKRQTTRK